MDDDSQQQQQQSADSVFNRKTKLAELKMKLGQKYQQFEDKIVPWKGARWGFFAVSLLLYFLRVFLFVGGFYIVTYTMSIHLLYCLTTLITPLNDPDATTVGSLGDDGLEGVSLASSGISSSKNGGGGAGGVGTRGGEHKPFIPKVQEFKVWRSMTRVVLIAFFCTFFGFLDLPVFWPILLLYFVILFVAQMSGRIQHMIQHKYVPWNANKPKFVAKDEK